MIEWCVVMGGGKVGVVPGRFFCMPGAGVVVMGGGNVVMVPRRFFCVPGAGVVVMGGVSVVMVPGKERSMTSQKQMKGVWSQKEGGLMSRFSAN